jgi:YesN/AraC family two-component response regulator
VEKKSILLVEDDDVVRDMIREGLERKYHVLEAATCSKAIELIKEPFDLALIDYNLPDSDGFEVLKAIRESKPKLPVIFMTAYSTDNLAIKAFRSGVTDYIRKPLSFAYLWAKLSEILEGKEAKELSESVGSREVFIMEGIAAFIEENYKEDLTRDELAQRARMEKYRFSRAFNKHFGKNVKSYVNTVRVIRAAEILSKSADLSITDIAVSVGYSGVTHFEKVFKQVYGISPNAYRKNQTGSSPTT